jgi:hypothetical protein
MVHDDHENSEYRKPKQPSVAEQTNTGNNLVEQTNPGPMRRFIFTKGFREPERDGEKRDRPNQ